MKKFLNIKSILCCVAVVLGLIAVLLLFADVIVPQKGSGDGYSGLDVAFGYKEKGHEILSASAYILPTLLAVIGVALAVVALFGKGGKIVPIIAAVCFIGAGICYFLPMQMITPYTKLSGDAKTDYIKHVRDSVKEACKLGAGAIVSGIFSIIAACSVVVPVFISKK